MGSKKLSWCCIIGIVLGFVAPRIWAFNQQTSLMIGLAGGLGLGYVLDILDEKKQKTEKQEVIDKKAAEALRLMEQARAELNGDTTEEDTDEPDPDEIGTPDEIPDEFPDLTAEEQAASLSEAEEMLRKARERLK